MGRLRRVELAAALVACLTASGALAQTVTGDVAVIVQFQRAADAYAFTCRAMADRANPMPTTHEGDLFTPLAAAMFRERLRAALTTGCELPAEHFRTFEIPQVGRPAGIRPELPACLARALPKLPPELVFRSAGTALLLVDTKHQVVVDVLHAAVVNSSQ